jgi:hypothetical protein
MKIKYSVPEVKIGFVNLNVDGREGLTPILTKIVEG